VDSVYDLYTRGCDLLAHGDHLAAIVPLTRARDLEPTKASIREALGRALFHAQRYERAAEEFAAIADAAPTNDYALFCLGRSLMQLGRTAEARKPLTLAANMNPKRRDYKIYRDRARKAA
jgi:Flp pilus assembly protein TadD